MGHLLCFHLPGPQAKTHLREGQTSNPAGHDGFLAPGAMWATGMAILGPPLGQLAEVYYLLCFNLC